MAVKTENGPVKLGNEEFGFWLADKRKDAGLTRGELAEQVGISYPYVSQLETGYRNPSTAIVFSLSRALGVSADEMLAVLYPPLMINEEGTMEMLRDAFTKRPRLISPGDKATVLGIAVDGPVISLSLNDGTTITLKADRRATEE